MKNGYGRWATSKIRTICKASGQLKSIFHSDRPFWILIGRPVLFTSNELFTCSRCKWTQAAIFEPFCEQKPSTISNKLHAAFCTLLTSKFVNILNVFQNHSNIFFFFSSKWDVKFWPAPYNETFCPWSSIAIKPVRVLLSLYVALGVTYNSYYVFK